MNGKTCGEECKGGCKASDSACCSMGSCNGCGCGCGHKAIRIIVKIAIIVIIFWAGMQFGEQRAFDGYGRRGIMQGAVPMMNR